MVSASSAFTTDAPASTNELQTVLNIRFYCPIGWSVERPPSWLWCIAMLELIARYFCPVGMPNAERDARAFRRDLANAERDARAFRRDLRGHVDAAARAHERDALLNALWCPLLPKSVPRWHWARAEAKRGPGPRCPFCLVLLRSVEWQLERCCAHWDVDIADCPGTEESVANYVSDH
jgi:hypothetical protein